MLISELLLAALLVAFVAHAGGFLIAEASLFDEWRDKLRRWGWTVVEVDDELEKISYRPRSNQILGGAGTEDDPHLFASDGVRWPTLRGKITDGLTCTTCTGWHVAYLTVIGLVIFSTALDDASIFDAVAIWLGGAGLHTFSDELLVN